jgi:hypothetical protein
MSRPREGVVISTFAWIAIGVAAWLAVSVVAGMLIGRMIRGRDQQVPQGPATDVDAAPHVPRQSTAAHPPTPSWTPPEPGAPPRP